MKWEADRFMTLHSGVAASQTDVLYSPARIEYTQGTTDSPQVAWAKIQRASIDSEPTIAEVDLSIHEQFKRRPVAYLHTEGIAELRKMM